MPTSGIDPVLLTEGSTLTDLELLIAGGRGHLRDLGIVSLVIIRGKECGNQLCVLLIGSVLDLKQNANH